MSPFFCKITEENKFNLTKPVDSDMVYYCELSKWHNSNAFRGFGIKYAIDNYIHYKIGRKELILQSNNFILTCKQPLVIAFFESKTISKDICIDIRPSTVYEAFTIILAKDDYHFDDYLANYFKCPNFFESVCPIKSAPALNQKLKGLVEDISSGIAHTTINKEWFFDLVEKIIYHEYGNYLALNGIHSVKTGTKKEILYRLKNGKQYMDENFLLIEDIAEVAVACNLSEFHFFRSFKQAFFVTPYQYLLQKRLALAKTFILTKEQPLNKIAAQCNFPDLPTFSKAFKRWFGVPPTQISSK